MINLEELTLSVSILKYDSNDIDGTNLYNDILVHMPQLNKFTFTIINQIVLKNIKIDFPSNDKIQSSFNKTKFNQIGSYADFDSTAGVARFDVSIN
jgi:hypothetical protein